MKQQTEVAITLPKLNIKNISLMLVGDSPLIVHAWSEKTKQEMLDKQMKKAKTARAAKDPEQLFKDSMYYMPDKKTPAFPAVAFKSAAVDACSHVEGVWWRGELKN